MEKHFCLFVVIEKRDRRKYEGEKNCFCLLPHRQRQIFPLFHEFICCWSVWMNCGMSRHRTWTCARYHSVRRQINRPIYIFFSWCFHPLHCVERARVPHASIHIYAERETRHSLCAGISISEIFIPFFFLYLLRKPASHWHCYYKLKTFSFVRMGIYGYIARRIYSIIMMMMYEHSKWDDTKAGEHSSFSLIYFYLSFSCVSNGADEWENWRQWRIFYHHHIHSPHIQL